MNFEPIKKGDDLRRDWHKINRLGSLVLNLKAREQGLSAGATGLNAAAFRRDTALFRLKSVLGDYLTCRTWDGTTEGGTDIYVAKSFKLRTSIAQEIIAGNTYNYTYYSTTYRVSVRVSDSATEDQYVVPHWLTDDLIWATPALTLVTVSGAPLVWLDDNRDARAWAAPTA